LLGDEISVELFCERLEVSFEDERISGVVTWKCECKGLLFEGVIDDSFGGDDGRDSCLLKEVGGQFFVEGKCWWRLVVVVGGDGSGDSGEVGVVIVESGYSGDVESGFCGVGHLFLEDGGFDCLLLFLFGDVVLIEEGGDEGIEPFLWWCRGDCFGGDGGLINDEVLCVVDEVLYLVERFCCFLFFFFSELLDIGVVESGELFLGFFEVLFYRVGGGDGVFWREMFSCVGELLDELLCFFDVLWGKFDSVSGDWRGDDFLVIVTTYLEVVGFRGEVSDSEGLVIEFRVVDDPSLLFFVLDEQFAVGEWL